MKKKNPIYVCERATDSNQTGACACERACVNERGGGKERNERNRPLTIILDRWTRLGCAYGAANGALNSGHGRVFHPGLRALLVGVRYASKPCLGGGSHAGLLLLLLQLLFHEWWSRQPSEAHTRTQSGWMDGQRIRRYMPVKTQGRCTVCTRPRRMSSVAVGQAEWVDWPTLQKITT